MKKKKSEKPVILLSIETKARELPGKVLLSCFLAEKGFKVILTNYRKIPFALKTKAWLYIDRNSFAPRMSFFRRLKFFGLKLVCIDEEGIIWRSPEGYKSRIHVKTNGYVDGYFTWGKKQTELIKEVSESISTVITGNPRIDLLRPELLGLYKNKSDNIKNRFKDYILFVSNLASYNHFYAKEIKGSIVDFIIDERKRQGIVESLEEEKYYRSYLENRKIMFEMFVALLKRLSAEFPDTNIIVRPHPSENHESWKDLLINYSNIHILYEGELTPWIIAAKAVIHNSCTTGVEAALLGLKAIAYVPLNEPEFECDLPNRVSASVTTENEVIELIKKSPISQPVPALLGEHISSLTGPFACDRITEQIENLYKKRSSKNVFKRKILFRNNPITRIISIYLRLLYEIYNLIEGRKILSPKRLKEYKKQKLEQITAAECGNLIDEYINLLQKFDKIQVDDKHGYIEIFPTD